MNSEPSEARIVEAVAEEAANSVCRKVIRELQSMKDTLSGEDSGLENTWDEICAQIQYEPSIYWDAYDETVRAIVFRHVRALKAHQSDAVWLQTREGSDWIDEEPEDREEIEDMHSDVTEYILDEYVYEQAGKWSNARIESYLDQQ